VSSGVDCRGFVPLKCPAQNSASWMAGVAGRVMRRGRGLRTWGTLSDMNRPRALQSRRTGYQRAAVRFMVLALRWQWRRGRSVPLPTGRRYRARRGSQSSPPTPGAGHAHVRLAHTQTTARNQGWTGRPGVVPKGGTGTQGDRPRASLTAARYQFRAGRTDPGDLHGHRMASSTGGMSRVDLVC
jgi:hypothetical protein